MGFCSNSEYKSMHNKNYMQEKLRKFLNFFENILVGICAYYAIWAVYARFSLIYNTRARRYIVWI